MTRELFQKVYYKAHNFATDKVGSDPRCWGDLLADKFCELLAKEEDKAQERAGLCERCKTTQATIQEWLDKQGHDRCWYYPEIFEKLAKIFGLVSQKPGQLPPRMEFEMGCARFQVDQYKQHSS